MFRHFLILCLFSVAMHQLVGHVSLEDGGTVWASLDEDGELVFENTASFPYTAMHQESKVKKEVPANPGQDKVLHGRIRLI